LAPVPVGHDKRSKVAHLQRVSGYEQLFAAQVGPNCLRKVG